MGIGLNSGYPEQIDGYGLTSGPLFRFFDGGETIPKFHFVLFNGTPNLFLGVNPSLPKSLLPFRLPYVHVYIYMPVATKGLVLCVNWEAFLKDCYSVRPSPIRNTVIHSPSNSRISLIRLGYTMYTKMSNVLCALDWFYLTYRSYVPLENLWLIHR